MLPPELPSWNAKTHLDDFAIGWLNLLGSLVRAEQHAHAHRRRGLEWAARSQLANILQSPPPITLPDSARESAAEQRRFAFGNRDFTTLAAKLAESTYWWPLTFELGFVAGHPIPWFNSRNDVPEHLRLMESNWDFFISLALNRSSRFRETVIYYGDVPDASNRPTTTSASMNVVTARSHLMNAPVDISTLNEDLIRRYDSTDYNRACLKSITGNITEAANLVHTLLDTAPAWTTGVDLDWWHLDPDLVWLRASEHWSRIKAKMASAFFDPALSDNEFPFRSRVRVLCADTVRQHNVAHSLQSRLSDFAIVSSREDFSLDDCMDYIVIIFGDSHIEDSSAELAAFSAARTQERSEWFRKTHLISTSSRTAHHFDHYYPILDESPIDFLFELLTKITSTRRVLPARFNLSSTATEME